MLSNRLTFAALSEKQAARAAATRNFCTALQFLLIGFEPRICPLTRQTHENMNTNKAEQETLKEEADHVIEESRMVLPGIQTLFGFQLIAVFNERFETKLLPFEQDLHLASTILVALAIAIIMTPAAYHRQAERGSISQYFVDLSSRLMTVALVPLALGIVLEVYLIAEIVLHSEWLGSVIAACLLLVFAALWFVMPQLKRLHNQNARRNV